MRAVNGDPNAACQVAARVEAADLDLQQAGVDDVRAVGDVGTIRVDGLCDRPLLCGAPLLARRS